MSDRRFYEAPAIGARRSAPAALRNREPIAEVLAEWLPERGLVLEIASGTGEHAAFFAERFPSLDWQPSDIHPDALTSIAAWRVLRTGTPPAPEAAPPTAHGEREALLHRLARLHAEFAGREPEVAAAEWAGYLAERARLKAALEAALAVGRAPQ